uniref:Uncharacterized protein n=1 Tax=Romanomermis culicivorax TaxID=13658 RepID=A0A915KN40_ROMCU
EDFLTAQQINCFWSREASRRREEQGTHYNPNLDKQCEGEEKILDYNDPALPSFIPVQTGRVPKKNSGLLYSEQRDKLISSYFSRICTYQRRGSILTTTASAYRSKPSRMKALWLLQFLLIGLKNGKSRIVQEHKRILFDSLRQSRSLLPAFEVEKWKKYVEQIPSSDENCKMLIDELNALLKEN